MLLLRQSIIIILCESWSFNVNSESVSEPLTGHCKCCKMCAKCWSLMLLSKMLWPFCIGYKHTKVHLVSFYHNTE